jgi:hypothetical protein
MSSEDAKDQAKTHGRRAVRQAGHAAKNTAKAAQLATAPAVEAVAEEIEDTAEKAVETARSVDVQAVSRGLSKTGQGAIALSLAITAASFAFQRFRQARAEKLIVGGPTTGPVAVEEVPG